MIQCIFLKGQNKEKGLGNGLDVSGESEMAIFCVVVLLCKLKFDLFSQDSQIQLRITNIMLHLDDLLEHQNQNSHEQLCQSSQKVNYFPELREIKEIDRTHSSLDTFYHHLGEDQNRNGCIVISQSDKTNDLISSENPPSCFEGMNSKKRPINKSRNQTKNIPKNFGKGIITFVEKNKLKLQPVIESYGLDSEEFISYLKTQKSKINTIAQLRGLWIGSMGGCIRVLSNLFFRKYALEYIFNSRISSFNSHIKYRASLWRALQQPQSFNHIKQY